MIGRIFIKVLSGVACLLLVAFVTVDFFASRAAESNYIQNLERQLDQKCRMAALSIEAAPDVEPKRIHALAEAARARITVVAPDGRVLADSDADAARMENHLQRPEIREALGGRHASRIRHSPTLGVDFLYAAVPVSQGALRLAVPLSDIQQQVAEVRRKIIASTALAFLPAIFLAALVARYISRRVTSIIAYTGELARGNFRARLGELDNSEFGHLARKLNEAGENLERTVAQLEREHAELERLERIRKDFVINVSHELRTPLASIQGYTETLIDGALEDRENNMRFLGIIRHNAERLARLTADLLTLSRIELRRQNFSFEMYPANELLREAMDLVRPLADKKHIRLVEQPAPEEAEVSCDAEAVSQILSNLLDNAIKYTPEGGVITVGAVPAAKSIRFSVRDSGSGIPEEDLPRLFERFYRVDKARSRALGGTGLGLSIVKHLVLAHGGDVWVESRANEGSTFSFTLPITREFNAPVTVS
ncbi:MAG TPA: ATP-binding protein [Bryobacteraceae bacterium]|nr:ATP-binding protein [Bryobacteraceae bacterium]